MCGIAGIFGASDEKALRSMLKTLVHRGPDDEHWVAGEGFCLGARRLSIIDVEGGRQPIPSENGRIWVAQNGEVYNFPELRPRFLKHHTFRTRCDTEILVHAYEDRGEDFVRCLNGMYAIALWDDEKTTSIIARDRVGKKPLYYCLRNGALYFASEIKALLSIPGLARHVNLEALHHYLSYRHVPCPLSMFQGIYQLPPAHVLIYHPGTKPRIHRYWRPDFSPRFSAPEKLIDRMEETLKRAVRRRLMSDVPVGFFLSGGIDSGLVAALAAEVSPTPIQTFTLTYAPGSETAGKQKDREFARTISEMYGTEHHEETIEYSFFPEEFPRILQHFDEPFAGVVSQYFLSRRIRKHVKVAVSGDGADELFGSYLSHRLAGPIARFGQGQTDALTKGLSAEKDRALARGLASKNDWEWRYKLLTFTDEEKKELYTSRMQEATGKFSTFLHLRGYFEGLTAGDPLNRILEAEFHSFLPDQVLTYADRLSMAHSLEVRAPYLDFEFVELASHIPGNLKINNVETKFILKKLAERYLPEEVVYRPKEGFVMPVHHWLQQNLEDYVRGVLSPERMERHGYFQTEPIQKYLDDYYRGREDLGAKVQTLLAFQVWHDLYIP